MRFFYLFAIFTISYSTTLHSQEYEKRWFVSGGDSLPYRIIYPLDYEENTDKEYPMVLFLHGAGERGKDNEKQLVHGSRLFADSLARYPAIVVFPQCPKNEYWATLDWERPNGDPKFPFYEQGEPPLESTIQLLEYLLEKERIDTRRLYLAGLSMGGFGTFELLARQPNTFAAAIPICGGGNKLLAPLYADNTRLWIFHGDADKVVPVGLSQKMYQALKDAGADVRYTEYPGVRHNSWDNAFAEPELLSWLFGQ